MIESKEQCIPHLRSTLPRYMMIESIEQLILHLWSTLPRETQESDLKNQLLTTNEQLKHYIYKSIKKPKNTMIPGEYNKPLEDKTHYNTLRDLVTWGGLQDSRIWGAYQDLHPKTLLIRIWLEKTSSSAFHDQHAWKPREYFNSFQMFSILLLSLKLKLVKQFGDGVIGTYFHAEQLGSVNFWNVFSMM